MDARSLLLGQELLHDVQVLHGLAQQDLLGDVGRVVVVLQEEHGQALLLLGLGALHDEVVAAQDLALAHVDDLDHGVHAVAGDGHDVLVPAGDALQA